ncbi:MAG: hypothetical protein H6613_18250 [Ignavibacteriales bacterium]|nr:hypothetical protein [Ignavibacteriales bacterium]
MKKLFLLITMITLISCSQNKNNEEQIKHDGDKSIQQQESEKHNFDSADLKFEVLENKTLVDGKLGHFQLPQFSADGKRLFFTNINYGEIWMWDFTNETLEKIVSLPQCGINFQISENGNTLYFRNKVTKGKKSFSIMSYTIDTKSVDVIYTSERRISTPILLNSSIYILEDDKPININLADNLTSEKFPQPFLFASNDKLIKVSNKIDTLSIPNNEKAISVKYSKDGENIFVLTSSIGVLVYDKMANPINNLTSSGFVRKLYKSNLLLFTEEEDQNDKIINSKLFIGFLNSDKKFEILQNEKSPKFYPDWSPTENKIVYVTEDGSIKLVSFNIEKN